MAKFRKGAAVEWPWGRGHVEGTVVEVVKESITRTIKGKKITRHGTKEKPAYVIRLKTGLEVLKLETELHVSKKLHGWA